MNKQRKNDSIEKAYSKQSLSKEVKMPDVL